MAIDREQTKAAIYRALEGEPEDFKLMVLDMAYQNGWDANDPSFLLLAATGQLRALLRLHPSQIQAAMDDALKHIKQEWIKWHTQTLTVATGVEITAQQMTARLGEVAQLMQAERNELKALMAAERAALATQMQEMARQQEQVLRATTEELIAEGIITQQKRADTQVKQIVESARAKYYWESISTACLLVMTVMALTLGLYNRAIRFSTWGQIRSWNQSDLQACREVDRSTCNFHIEPP